VSECRSSSTETHLIIKGVVQGVFFRAKAKHVADRLGIRGYVCNLSDGCVEICITRGDVEAFVSQLRREASLPIRIDSIERREQSLLEDYPDFQVKYL